MVQTVIFITQSYLNFASREALEQIKPQVRLVLLMYGDETINQLLQPFMDEIVRVDGTLNDNVRPVFDREQVTAIVRREIQAVGSADAVRMFCQEECNVLLAAQVRQELGIHGDRPERVQLFRDKLAMKQAVVAHGIHVPHHETLDKTRLVQNPSAYYSDLRDRLGERLVIKPTSSAGSFNVAIIDNEENFLEAQTLALDENYRFEYEVDEFISGKMYQCDSFTRKGKVEFSGILELGCTNFDFVQGKPLSVYPALTPALYASLFDFNQKVITVLDFQEGATHLELFIKDDTGEIVFLEIAARVPGGIGVPFHTKNSDINLIDATLYLTVDETLLANLKPHSRNNVVSALLPVGHGTVSKLNEPDIESHYDITWHIKPGAVVNSRSLVDNAGILTLYNDDPVTLRRDFERLNSYVPVECV